jgi:hypothetical protein
MNNQAIKPKRKQKDDSQLSAEERERRRVQRKLRVGESIVSWISSSLCHLNGRYSGATACMFKNVSNIHLVMLLKFKELALKLKKEGKTYKPQKHKRKLFVSEGAGKTRREKKREKNSQKSAIKVRSLS